MEYREMRWRRQPIHESRKSSDLSRRPLERAARGCNSRNLPAKLKSDDFSDFRFNHSQLSRIDCRF